MVVCHIYGEAGYYPPLTPVAGVAGVAGPQGRRVAGFAGTGVKNLTLVFRTGKVLTEVMST